MHIVTLGGVRTSLQRILVFVTALLVFAALAGFLKWTRAGKAMRAVAQNREASSVVGVSLERIGMLAVVAAAVLAGVSAVLVAPLSDVEPTMGTATLLKAFAAVIVGGFGSVTGAISSSFVIGLTEAFSIAYISSAYADGIVFAVMITILLLRPHGLFGRAVRA
jgi:branched-chain amino acid transport system permease protein